MAFYDVASNRHVNLRKLNPRFLGRMALYDVASDIWLARGAGGVRRDQRRHIPRHAVHAGAEG